MKVETATEWTVHLTVDEVCELIAAHVRDTHGIPIEKGNVWFKVNRTTNSAGETTSVMTGAEGRRIVWVG